MNKLLILLGIGVAVAACDNVGGSANVAVITASVTSGNCSGVTAGNVGMATGESCAITINYNNLGGTGNTLSSNPSFESLPLSINAPNSTFSNTFKACQSKMSSSSSGTCDPIVITYTKIPLVESPDFALSFTAVAGSASATTTPIQVKGQ
ncbi:MAG: hypothetical protein K0R49_1619 [Burkholderiales bacterium]|jgi:hypothetical protein|nr:hypothetical protein [Burkholderiales bacterium]MCE3269365.1 hypothetical protein [Burkholderiales bacterium]